MTTRTAFTRLSFLLCFAIAVSACSDDDNTTNTTPEEFTAQSSNFAGFRSWAQTITPQHGPDPGGFLHDAHAANDDNMTRYIYVNNASATRNSSGNYPNGTIFVKEMKMSDGSSAGVLAMVKRGGSFNSGNRGWEWFMLDSAGTIQDRSATLMNGLCNGCHVAASAKDFAFTKN